MARPKLDHEQRRETIARAACEVILEVGLENAKLVEIGARSGTTTGAVQHYFRSKEELLLYVKNHAFDLIYAKSRDALDENVGVERLYALTRQFLPTNREHIKAIRLLEAFRGRAVGNPALMRHQHQRDLIFLTMLQEEIDKLKAEGLIDGAIDTDQAALGLNALIDGLGCIVMASPSAYKTVDLFAIAESHISKVLGMPASTRGKSA
jgi:AcrR family transcriptional regulator